MRRTIVFTGILLLSFSAVSAQLECPLSKEEIQAYTTTEQTLKAYSIHPASHAQMFLGCQRGMVAEGYAEDELLAPGEMPKTDSETDGVATVGLELMPFPGGAAVISPFDDGPAFDAGIRHGDLILRVDGTPVSHLTANQISGLLRGEPGSTVVLQVRKQDQPETVRLTLQRSISHSKSVKPRLLEPGYGYLRISKFERHTLDELLKSLDSLTEQSVKPLRGLILDLRDCPGGALGTAVYVAGVFMPEKALIGKSVGRAGKIEEEFWADFTRKPLSINNVAANVDFPVKIAEIAKTVPIVVLVNGGTASGAEIVASALQDKGRAKLVGSTTFGRDSIQTLVPISLDNTYIKVTTATWISPNGRSFSTEGITPDFVVEMKKGPGLDNQLSRAFAILRGR